MSKRADIIVAGAGPVGLIAALAAARAGFSVTLCGPKAGTADRRTTALMQPAIDALNSLGVLDNILPQAAPLRVMRIIDGTKRLIRSPIVTFHASEVGAEYFGLNIPNSVLVAALDEQIASHPEITRLETSIVEWTIDDDAVQAALADGQAISARLVIAADGRLSMARDAAGIDSSTTRYPQAALVASFTHSRDHGFVSNEFHTETGPFTQVPLPGKRSSLVWVVEPQRADELASLDTTELSRLIENQMGSMLGNVTAEPGCQVYPLSATLPASFAKNRVALVGEAAHVFPPIGAQGLNLGIRDVQDLIETISESASDAGSKETLRRYDAKRRPDVLARAGAVRLLNRSLLSNMLPMQIARTGGLGLLGSISPLRVFFMQETLKPGTGLLGIRDALRKQIGRKDTASDRVE